MISPSPAATFSVFLLAAQPIAISAASAAFCPFGRHVFPHLRFVMRVNPSGFAFRLSAFFWLWYRTIGSFFWLALSAKILPTPAIRTFCPKSILFLLDDQREVSKGDFRSLKGALSSVQDFFSRT